uniref:Uncharacterized protein n=1 Tax=Pectinophora gossypiella TaxID=13191 RepID=A0A1E1WEX1_PECGO
MTASDTPKPKPLFNLGSRNFYFCTPFLSQSMHPISTSVRGFRFCVLIIDRRQPGVGITLNKHVDVTLSGNISREPCHPANRHVTYHRAPDGHASGNCAAIAEIKFTISARSLLVFALPIGTFYR